MERSLLLSLAAIFLFACKPNTERIRIKLEKGQKYSQHTLIKMTNLIPSTGRKMDITNIVEVINKYEVIAVSDSIYTIKVTYQSIDVKVLVDGEPSPMEKSPITDFTQKMMGHSYTIKETNTGHIVQTTGAGSIVSEVIKEMPELTDEVKAKLDSTFIKTYGDKAIKKNNLQNEYLYPHKEVKEGDKWSASIAAGADILSPKTECVYKVDEITPSEYVISMKSRLSFDYTDKSSPHFGVKMSGTVDAVNRIDRKTGLVTESKTQEEMTTNSKVSRGSQSYIDESARMVRKVETTVSVTLID